MEHINKSIDFFKSKLQCPICGDFLTRHIIAKFLKHTKELHYTSCHKDKDLYDNFSFMHAWFDLENDEDELRDPTGIPTIINLKDSMPPAIKFLNFKNIYLSCPNIEKHYTLGTDSTLSATKEYFIYDGLSIHLHNNIIIEDVHKLRVKTDNIPLLKHNGESIKNLVRKLILLQ